MHCSREIQSAEIWRLNFSEPLKESLSIFQRIFVVEVLSIARRLGIKIDYQTLLSLIEEFNVKSEGELFNLAVYVAENIHPRAVDAYYIATAILTGSVLVSNDRVMVKNSRRAGINAFYLLEEFEELKQFLKPG
jgi:predicted nucleic acid-binding protein